MHKERPQSREMSRELESFIVSGRRKKPKQKSWLIMYCILKLTQKHLQIHAWKIEAIKGKEKRADISPVFGARLYTVRTDPPPDSA